MGTRAAALIFSLCFWALFPLLTVPAAAQAPESPVKAVSWAPSSGVGALWFDALSGLKASTAMFNAHGGVKERHLLVDGFNIDPLAAVFLPTLSQHLKAAPSMVVGGLNRPGSGEAAELCRRFQIPWLGPWSNDPALYQGLDFDPLPVLPTWNQELAALLEYVRDFYEANESRRGQVHFVYYDLPAEQPVASEALRLAKALGLNLTRNPLAPSFGNWPLAADHLKDAGAVIVWLSAGSAAALALAIRDISPGKLLLSNSLNATHRNLVLISHGAWNGVIFPAVLRPSSDIAEAYAGLLHKYGPVGLQASYHAYLGFAQGQLLARALSLAPQGSSAADLRQALAGLQGFQTLFWTPLGSQAPLFYLARAYGNGYWEMAQPLPPASAAADASTQGL